VRMQVKGLDKDKLMPLLRIKYHGAIADVG
jgi:hypothetical protein